MSDLFGSMGAGRDRRRRVVGEDAVDAEPVEVREQPRAVTLGLRVLRRARVALPVLHGQEGVLRPYGPRVLVPGRRGVTRSRDRERRTGRGERGSDYRETPVRRDPGPEAASVPTLASSVIHRLLRSVDNLVEA